MKVLDEVKVKNLAGNVVTWTLFEDEGEYLIQGEAVDMRTKVDVIGRDEQQARGIFKRLFKKER